MRNANDGEANTNVRLQRLPLNLPGATTLKVAASPSIASAAAALSFFARTPGMPLRHYAQLCAMTRYLIFSIEQGLLVVVTRYSLRCGEDHAPTPLP